MDFESMQTETVESTTPAEVTTDAGADDFDVAWDGDGQTAGDEMELDAEEAGGSEAEADQQEAETAEASENAEKPEKSKEQKDESADQRFRLKHLGEETEVGREEVIALAQKGLDYDRKTASQSAKIAEYEEFLKELCPPNTSVEQLMDLTRARILKASEEKAGRNISEADAILRVQQNRAEKKAAAKREADAEKTRIETEAKAKNDEAIRRFVDVYGNVDPKDIPQSVWEEAKKDGDLLGAYTRYENKQLKADLEALRQTEKNKARSTGSLKSQGAAAAKDPFDAAWDSF